MGGNGGTIILKNAHFSPPNSDQKGDNVRIQRIEGMTVEPLKNPTFVSVVTHEERLVLLPPVLPSFVRFCKAFPPITEDVVSLLVGTSLHGKALSPFKSTARGTFSMSLISLFLPNDHFGLPDSHLAVQKLAKCEQL